MSHHLYAKGIDTHYTLTGQGPDVVLLHGFTESQAVFDGIKPYLSGCRLLCPDLPGHGHTTIAPHYQTIDDYAGWLHELLDLLGMENPIVIGHSLGGYVALAYARHRPVAGLGLWHSTALPDSPERRVNRDRGRDFVLEHGVGRYISGLIPQLFPTDTDGHIQQVLTLARQTSQQGIVQTLAAMRDRPDCTAVLQRLQVPVLLLHGLRDRIIPLDDVLAQARLPRRAMYVGLAEVAHMGMYEDPQACGRALAAFLHFCGI